MKIQKGVQGVRNAVAPCRMMHQKTHLKKKSVKQRKDVDGKLKKTINENEFKRKREQLNETLPEGKDMCPDCHLQLEDGVCPSCGYKINNDENKQEKENNMKNGNVNTKTVRFDPKEGKEEGRFALTPISGKTREAEGV